ncbi:ABC transporter ATP-binding protein [Sporosarcina sp. SAFN-015]|uniref:ABC transporter ATP-binding protein n=1 Tax=Sporosarcina sp. SAFN-015 TaxID=3387274 RepID=UPI003F81E39E
MDSPFYRMQLTGAFLQLTVEKRPVIENRQTESDQLDIVRVQRTATEGWQMEIVRVSNLQKAYGENNVLKGIDFTANAGEIIGVIGKNGAGKSTFLEILMTLKPYDNGNVAILDNELNTLTTSQIEHIRKNISAVLQPTQFYKTLKVIELLKLFKAYYNSTVDIEQIVSDFKLEPHRKKYFDKLSGGWKQIVSLAIAFLSEPKLLILDEPTTGLDPHMRNTLWTYITDYNKRTGGTVILTTHNMDEVELYCDKVMLLNEGLNEVFDSTEGILSTGYKSINDFYLSKVSI